MKKIVLLLISVILYSSEIKVEILGSGGPEIDGRASASYIVWLDNKAIALIDTGSGSMLNFEKSGAKLEDLDAILISHLHIDHVVDLPSYIKAGYFTKRRTLLPIIGPDANSEFPSMSEYLELSFGEKGTYRYMRDVLTPQSESFQIKAINVNSNSIKHFNFKHFKLDVINVHHGMIPALAFALHVKGKTIVFSGDTNNKDHHLEKILKGADLFVAHHAIGEYAGAYAKKLHMNPTIIGEISQRSGVKKIVLTHRMLRTIGEEKNSLALIKHHFNGEVIFAEDSTTFSVP